MSALSSQLSNKTIMKCVFLATHLAVCSKDISLFYEKNK